MGRGQVAETTGPRARETSKLRCLASGAAALHPLRALAQVVAARRRAHRLHLVLAQALSNAVQARLEGILELNAAGEVEDGGACESGGAGGNLLGRKAGDVGCHAGGLDAQVAAALEASEAGSKPRVV